MKKIASAFLGSLLLLVAACKPPAEPAPPQGRHITPELVDHHVRVLASDLMEGRGVGTKGIDAAALYISQEMERSGLAPGGDNGTWFQNFDMTVGVRLGTNNALTLGSRSGDTPLTLDHDWRPLQFSESGKVDANVIFAGYGITAPEMDWDDYAGVDVKGKVVLVFRHEPGEQEKAPQEHSPEHALEHGQEHAKEHAKAHELSRYSELRMKAINARLHGAVAMILVNDALVHPGEEDALAKLEPEGDASFAGLLAVQISRAAVDRMLVPSGTNLERLERALLDTGKPSSHPLEAAATITVDLEKTRQPVKNVIGILKGMDEEMSKQAVVVGAHYDHLGYGGRSSLDPDKKGQIHNGADDNASGVAALLGAAQHLGRHPDGPCRRTIIFMAFTGEESGLVGSSWWVNHPTWDLSQIDAMLNMDMVGRMVDRKLVVFGAATAVEFDDILDDDNVDKLNISAHGDGYGPSDQTSFYSKGIPVLHFFTGAHADYHRVSDKADKINGAGLAQVAMLVARVAGALADRDNRVTFVASQNIARAQGSVGNGEGRGYGAYFGSIPDFTESEQPGVPITGVRSGSPAETAGLAAGDRIVKFGEVVVGNLYDLSFALKKYKPGDEVEVSFVRGSETKVVKATLAAHAAQ